MAACEHAERERERVCATMHNRSVPSVYIQAHLYGYDQPEIAILIFTDS